MIKIQSVSVPGCVECAHFEKFWKGVENEFPNAEMENVDATTPEGQALVTKHGIMASPGILINGELFSIGGVNKDEFLKKIRELSEGGANAANATH